MVFVVRSLLGLVIGNAISYLRVCNWFMLLFRHYSDFTAKKQSFYVFVGIEIELKQGLYSDILLYSVFGRLANIL
jgi:hypothetical protein